MNLGVILAIGESFQDLEKKGQLKRLLNYNIKSYSKNFDKVFIFSYKNDKNFKLPKNCYLVSNKREINRYIYSLTMPFIKHEQFRQCDVIRGLQITGGIPGFVAKVFFGKRFIINYGYNYSKFARIENKKLQSFIFKLIQFPLLRTSDKVIVTSKEIYKELSPKIERKKLAYIPNGVDIKLFKPLVRRKSNLFTVMFIGRIEKQKNLENLIIAAQNIPKIKIVFVGAGSQKDQLMTLSKKKKVELNLISPIDYAEIPKKLAEADVFALPSSLEGNPKILLEAMACEKAVIGCNVAGTREIIKNGRTGILTDLDSESLALGLSKLLNPRLREKLGREARKYVIENFDIEKLLNRENKLLQESVK